MRKYGFGMLMAVVCSLLAAPVLANQCGYPARTIETLENFGKYAGVTVQNVAVKDSLDHLQQVAEEDLKQADKYRASFTAEERKAFFDEAEAGVARRVALLKELAAVAKSVQMPMAAIAWVDNHVTALTTCGESVLRTETGKGLAMLADVGQRYKDDAIVASILDSLPQACNDTLVNTVSAVIPEPGTRDAYTECANLLVKTASRDNPDHFMVHHALADPACELATRIEALARGAKPVRKLTSL